jgi:2-oxoglutarate ferredoxin oxidoreductase subunit delta
MAGKIIIDTERCKGCGLCVAVCPKGIIVIAEESNKNGYFPAQATGAGCTACTQCALVCPDAVIEVLAEQAGRVRIIAASGRKGAPPLIEEKA